MRIRDAVGVLLRTIAHAVDGGAGALPDVATAAYEAGKAIGVAQERFAHLPFDDDDDLAVMRAAMDQVEATGEAFDAATRGSPE